VSDGRDGRDGTDAIRRREDDARRKPRTNLEIEGTVDPVLLCPEDVGQMFRHVEHERRIRRRRRMRDGQERRPDGHAACESQCTSRPRRPRQSAASPPAPTLLPLPLPSPPSLSLLPARAMPAAPGNLPGRTPAAFSHPRVLRTPRVPPAELLPRISAEASETFDSVALVPIRSPSSSRLPLPSQRGWS